MQEKPFSKESKHRRMKTIQVEDSASANLFQLKTAATPKVNDDEKSIAVSQFDKVWDDHTWCLNASMDVQRNHMSCDVCVCGITSMGETI